MDVTCWVLFVIGVLCFAGVGLGCYLFETRERLSTMARAQARDRVRRVCKERGWTCFGHQYTYDGVDTEVSIYYGPEDLTDKRGFVFDSWVEADRCIR